ncbi:hypothetical protein D3C80_1866560 [compost metagenome]
MSGIHTIPLNRSGIYHGYLWNQPNLGDTYKLGDNPFHMITICKILIPLQASSAAFHKDLIRPVGSDFIYTRVLHSLGNGTIVSDFIGECVFQLC